MNAITDRVARILPRSSASHRPRRVRVLAGAAVLALVVAAGGQAEGRTPPALVDGAAADEPHVSLGAEWNVYSPGPGLLAAFANIFGVDEVRDGVTRKRMFVSWAANRDSASADTIDGVAVSQDNGLSFVPAPEVPTSALNPVRLDDGSLLFVDFLPTTVDGELGVSTSRSTDLGATWTTTKAPIDAGLATFAWIRVHRGIHQLVDGTLLMPVYGAARGESANRSWLLQSSDRGQTWSVRSQISDTTAASNTNETTIARTSDGRLTALMRTSVGENLLQTFSSDDGLTWSKPAVIAAPEGAPRGWVDPGLTLQPNGMLVLTYGRPDNHILVSRDGTGRTWDDHRLVLANPVRETQPARYHGSSGNTGIASVAANQSIVVGDSCANIWGCRERGQVHRVWARRVDAVTAGAGKLDLATRVHEGAIRLSGEVAAADPRFPETRIEGAVDGSAERHAAARLTGGSLVVELDRVHTLNRIGLMLAYGTAQDADVQVSVDGRRWSHPVVTVRDTVDYALRYTEFEPVPARYVKISEPRRGDLDAVTELELYADDLMTFENDAVDAPPRGFTDTRYAWVADTIFPAFHSARRLTLVDLDPESSATATLPTDPAGSQRIAFAYAGSAYGAGLVIDVRGRAADGSDVVAWRFHLQPNAAAGRFTLRAFDGQNWQVVGTSGTQPVNETWMPVAIETIGGEATVTVNGTALTTTHRWQDAGSFTGMTVSTWGPDDPKAVNMQHDFDDIEITALS